MSNFRIFDRQTGFLLPPSVDENRQETAIGNGSRWLDGLGGPGRAVAWIAYSHSDVESSPYLLRQL
jgi:hypothetical protein